MITEADTCRNYILPKLYDSGWTNEQRSEQKSQNRLGPNPHISTHNFPPPDFLSSQTLKSPYYRRY